MLYYKKGDEMKKQTTDEFNLSEKIKEHFYDVDAHAMAPFIDLIDVKKFIRLLRKSIDESADESDIWDNERYDKFKKMVFKELKSQVEKGEKLCQ